MKTPTAMATNPATLALILAASGNVAPIRFAIRVEAAMEMGKGISANGAGVSFSFLKAEGGIIRTALGTEMYFLLPKCILCVKPSEKNRFRNLLTKCTICECGEDRLGSEDSRAEVGGGEGQDFKSEALGFYHDEAREGETDHGKPIVEGWANVRRSVHLSGH